MIFRIIPPWITRVTLLFRCYLRTQNFKTLVTSTWVLPPPCNSRKGCTFRFKRDLLLTSFWDTGWGQFPNINMFHHLTQPRESPILTYLPTSLGFFPASQGAPTWKLTEFRSLVNLLALPCSGKCMLKFKDKKSSDRKKSVTFHLRGSWKISNPNKALLGTNHPICP